MFPLLFWMPYVLLTHNAFSYSHHSPGMLWPLTICFNSIIPYNWTQIKSVQVIYAVYYNILIFFNINPCVCIISKDTNQIRHKYPSVCICLLSVTNYLLKNVSLSDSPWEHGVVNLTLFINLTFLYTFSLLFNEAVRVLHQH